MVNNDTLIRLATSGSTRVVCPECGGGSSNERSMTVRVDGLAAHFNCYRDSCAFGYRRIMLDGSVVLTPRAASPRRTYWEGITRPLEGLEEAEFNMNFFDTKLDIRITEDGRAVIPILDRHGTRRGDVVRQPKPYNNDMPKAISLYEEGYSGLAWFMPDGSEDMAYQTLCCVEDSLSAMRLAQHGVVGVALLGTRLTRDKFRDIKEWTGYYSYPLNLALDADASRTAIKQARLLRNMADIRVHRLYNDVKDQSPAELREFLQVLMN